MSLEYFRFVRSFNHINQKPFMLPNFPEFFQDSLLPFIVLVFAYVVFCFCRGPSGVSGTIKIRDTPMSRFKTGSLVIGLQVWALFIGTYHALLAYFLFPTENSLRINLSLLCPNPGRLNPKLFIWTPYTSFCLIMGLAPGIARLQAFWMLGKDFTLHLAEPDRLVRDGFYRYARHPSYALWAVTWWSAIALLGRVDGTSVSLFPLFSFATSSRFSCQFHDQQPLKKKSHSQQPVRPMRGLLYDSTTSPLIVSAGSFTRLP